MTVKILSSSFPNLIEFEPSHGNYKSKSKFGIPSPVRKPRCTAEPRVKVNVEAKGRKYPEIRQKLTLRLTKDELKNVLLRQILNEERSALKLTGVAIYYARLYQDVLVADCSEAESKCPFCECAAERSFLVSKLQRDVEYVIGYAANSPPNKKKQKLFNSLKPHKGVSSTEMAERGCHFSYLGRSDSYNASLISWVSDANIKNSDLDDSCWIREAEKLAEVKNGKKDALKLLKMQILKSRKCGLCDSIVNVQEQTRILCKIDKTLERLR